MGHGINKPAAAATGALAALATAASLGVGAAGAAGPAARAAGTVSLNDSAHLHLTSGHKLTLNEAGTAHGTIGGPMYIHLTLASGNRVYAEVRVYPSGGFIGGRANATYHVVGGYAYFSGTMSVTEGGERYAGAHGSGMRFTGTIQRSNDAVSVQVNGRMTT